MKDIRRLSILALTLLVFLSPPAAYADPTLDGEDDALEDQLEPGTLEEPALDDEFIESPAVPPASLPSPSLPRDPARRVQMAEEAFHHADFELLRPLLEPVLENGTDIADPALRLRARRLLGVGLFFEAQQVADADHRAELLARARGYFLDLLLEDPDENLDPMIFPASVVELFEDVRQEHTAELEAVLAARQQAPRAQSYEMQTLYIEREVRANHLVLNFFPLGIGQFQNRSPIKGTLFAAGQIAALTVNVLSYYMIERLRGEGGFFRTDTDNRGGDYALALGWRNAQFSALGAFGALYGWSIIDGLVNFEPFYIHIRTLDGAPPELASSGSGQPAGHGLGWSVKLRW